ncbi:MAG: TetR/AcrR family transcriptional regulator [Solimonas sp.]
MPVKRPRAYNSPVREAAADETRQRVMAAARVLLAGGKGLPAFSLDAAARQAGVTRLTVYKRFESKRGLLEAVFDEMARDGGLYGLPAVLAGRDTQKALRDFIGVFCRFWSNHGSVMPRLSAVARLDDDIVESLMQRNERRRQGLAVLVARLLPDANKKPAADVVDILFALTGFEMYAALAVHGREAAAVEALIVGLAEQTVRAAA